MTNLFEPKNCKSKSKEVKGEKVKKWG